MLINDKRSRKITNPVPMATYHLSIVSTKISKQCTEKKIFFLSYEQDPPARLEASVIMLYYCKLFTLNYRIIS